MVIIRLDEDRAYAANYFSFHDNNLWLERKNKSARHTSKRLFSKLKGAPSIKEVLHQASHEPPHHHLKDQEKLFDWYRKLLFPQWKSQLSAGFNLAMVGYGDKRNVLGEFAASPFMQDCHWFMFEGWKKGMELACFLNFVVEKLQVTLPTLAGTRDVVSLAKQLEQCTKEFAALIVIWVDQLDCESLRTAMSIEALTILARSSRIRLIGSMENIHTLGLWSLAHAERFNFIWHDLTTFRPYLDQVQPLMEKTVVSRTEHGRVRGAAYVLASLNRNAQGIFAILVRECLGSCSRPKDLEKDGVLNAGQIANGKDDDGDDDNDDDDGDDGDPLNGLTFHAWYQRSLEQFLVSNELAFRTQLTEFHDHDLICTSGSLLNGSEVYTIPLSKSEISKLDQLVSASNSSGLGIHPEAS